MTTQALVDYYTNLLILQYHGKPKASATISALATMAIMPQTSVQLLQIDPNAFSGSFTLGFEGNTSGGLAHNTDAPTVQAALRLLPGLSAITVTGTSPTGFTITMVGVTPVAPLIYIDFSNVNPGPPTIVEVDDTLKLAVQNGYNLIGDTVTPFLLNMYFANTFLPIGFNYVVTAPGPDSVAALVVTTSFYPVGYTIYVSQIYAGDSIDFYNSVLGFVTSVGAGNFVITITNPADPSGFVVTPTNAFPPADPNTLAVGVQLDVLGKYTGVTRSGQGFSGPITLDDTDFRTLIQIATIKNSAGSSLATIQALIAQYFSGKMLVFDYQNMRMSYLISTSLGSSDLIQLFVTEGLLPRPMGVELASIIYAPIITQFFGFRTYTHAAFNANPFNSYSSYNTTWPWLSYANAIGA